MTDAIGQRVAKLRHGAGLSQAQLAARLGITPASVAYYETGRTRPSLENLVQLARLFGVTTDALLGCQPLPDFDEGTMLLRQLTPMQRKTALALLRALRT